MPGPIDPYRAFRIVTGVVEEALRASGRVGAVISGGGPEETILRGWLEEAGIPWEAPTSHAVEGARRALLGAEGTVPPGSRSTPGWSLDAEVSALAGVAQSRTRDLLHLGTSNKTCLLLSPTMPVQPVLPLGDIYASEVRTIGGSCTVPPCLRHASHETWIAVDLALRAYLEEGFDRREAFLGLDPEVGDQVLGCLAGARRAWRPTPLIPKLSRATLGLDLDL